MIVLNDFATYTMGEYDITVRGINCDEFGVIAPLCYNMDRQVKDRILKYSQDGLVSSALHKSANHEELSHEELLALMAFNQANQELTFTINECKELVDAYRGCIVDITTADGTIDKQEFIEAIIESPKYLRAVANIVYTEYKDAIQLPEIKKSNSGAV